MVSFSHIRGVQIPFLDIWPGVGLNGGWQTCHTPRSQDEVLINREFGLAHACQRTLLNHWLDDSRHLPGMADLIAVTFLGPAIGRRRGHGQGVEPVVRGIPADIVPCHQAADPPSQ